MQVEDQVRDTIAPLLESFSVNLWDVELKGSRLRILVDTAQGIDTETLGLVSRTLSRELDNSHLAPNNYTLEVSSPGLDRALNRLEHFTESLGARISIKLKTPIPPPSLPPSLPPVSLLGDEALEKKAPKGEVWRVSGTLISADEKFIEIQDSQIQNGKPEADETGEDIIQIPRDNIKQAQVIFAWEADRV